MCKNIYCNTARTGEGAVPQPSERTASIAILFKPRCLANNILFRFFFHSETGGGGGFLYVVSCIKAEMHQSGLYLDGPKSHRLFLFRKILSEHRQGVSATQRTGCPH